MLELMYKKGLKLIFFSFCLAIEGRRELRKRFIFLKLLDYFAQFYSLRQCSFMCCSHFVLKLVKEKKNNALICCKNKFNITVIICLLFHFINYLRYCFRIILSFFIYMIFTFTYFSFFNSFPRILMRNDTVYLTNNFLYTLFFFRNKKLITCGFFFSDLFISY